MRRDYLTRKESIILTAIEIIDELGIQELSTREIAKRQEVSDASLYRHFNSKQDILIGVLDYYSQFDSMIKNTIINNKLQSKESIVFFYKSFTEYYENFPAITAITHSYSIFLHDAILGSKIKDIYEKRRNYIIELIKHGQANKQINNNFEDEELADTIIGIFRAITLRWRMNEYSFSLKDKALSSLNSLLEVC